jgi:hypothetical protein
MQYVTDVRTELRFNLDEAGSQERADWKPGTVIILHYPQPIQVNHYVSLGEKLIIDVTTILI